MIVAKMLLIGVVIVLIAVLLLCLISLSFVLIGIILDSAKDIKEKLREICRGDKDD